LPDIIRVIKSKWIRWHVASMGERRNAYDVSLENHEGKSPLGRSRPRWRIISKWFSGRSVLHGDSYTSTVFFFPVSYHRCSTEHRKIV
jgi:hypothetical protein